MVTWYFHIGFPKTGSTYLQKVIFPKLDINYLGQEASKYIFHDLIYKDDLDYKPDNMREELLKSKDQDSIFSFESFFPPFIYAGINKTVVAKRLKKMGDDLNIRIRILIGIRNQAAMIQSIYCQYLNQGGTASFNDYLFPSNHPNRLNLFNFDYLNYNNLLNFYYELFEEKNVMILQQERMRANTSNSIKELHNFFSLKGDISTNSKSSSNERLSNFSYRILRFSNYFTKNYFNPTPLLPYIRNGHFRKLMNKFDAVFKPGKKRFKVSRNNQLLLDQQLLKYERQNISLDKGLNLNLSSDYFDFTAK